MRSLVALCLLGLALAWSAAAASAADTNWTGTWDTRWRDGGARVELQQEGEKVTGIYPAYGGRIEGSVEGRQLTGRWIEGARSGGLEFVLAPDGQTFMGRFANGEWWTGGRVAAAVAADEAADRSSPRALLGAFVAAGNAARNGAPDALAAAGRLIDFGSATASLLPGQRIEAARQLFALVDQTTFHLWTVPGDDATGDRVDVRLTQAGTGAPLPLTMVREDGKWFILDPTTDVTALARKALFARYGVQLPAADDYKLRHSPRDALRSFLAGFADWNGSGREQSLAALDLSRFPEAVRDYEGELAAEYLRQILDRVGAAVPQEVPDDPASRDPYVLFSHPVGNVVIAPVGTGKDVTWSFTADSVQTARSLYVAVEDLPRLGGAASEPLTAYFKLRQWIRDRAPSLLNTMGELEAWQAIAWALVLAVSAALAVVLTLIIVRTLLAATKGNGIVRELRWPVMLALTFSIYKLIIPIVGLPVLSKQISVGTTGVLLAVALMWGGWRIADLVVDLYFRRDTRAATMDNIVVSLAFGAIKLAILACGLVFIAIELSLPYEGVIAGLSIGGLAVAFASRETISNVFGAGVLAIDRPFRRGDWIVAGDTEG